MRAIWIAAFGFLCLVRGAIAGDANPHNVRLDLLHHLMDEL